MLSDQKKTTIFKVIVICVCLAPWVKAHPWGLFHQSWSNWIPVIIGITANALGLDFSQDQLALGDCTRTKLSLSHCSSLSKWVMWCGIWLGHVQETGSQLAEATVTLGKTVDEELCMTKISATECNQLGISLLLKWSHWRQQTGLKSLPSCCL